MSLKVLTLSDPIVLGVLTRCQASKAAQVPTEEVSLSPILIEDSEGESKATSLVPGIVAPKEGSVTGWTKMVWVHIWEPPCRPRKFRVP